MARRETIGARIKRVRHEQKLTALDVALRAIDVGKHVGESTIRDIESDKSPNPGVKTLEAIALGLGLDPMGVISLGLDDPPELDRGYSETQFAQLARIYKKVKKENKPFADLLVKMVTEQIDRLR